MRDLYNSPITLEEARAALRQAVATQGDDFVYYPRNVSPEMRDQFMCSNLPEPNSGVPTHRLTGCLVGVALSILEVPIPHEKRYFTVTAFYPELTSGAVCYLARAQGIQDNGGTWGEAYKVAEEVAGVANLPAII